MTLSSKIKILFIALNFIVPIVNASTLNVTKICLTGRIEENLPAYKETFTNAASLAINEMNYSSLVQMKLYLYGNEALSPLVEYQKMRSDHCSAIIGFEYLTDLLLAVQAQRDKTVPVFTSYSSTLASKELPSNIFVFSPTYDFLAGKMFSFLQRRFGRLNNILIATEVNRASMSEYTEAYEAIFKKNNIKYDNFYFLETDQNLPNDLKIFLGKKHYDYVFLMSGAIGSAQIANVMNDQKTIFIGTENFGSYELPSFYLLLNNKKIRSFFIRNISYLNPSKELLAFQEKYEHVYGSQPTALSAYTYDAVKIILTALANGKSLKNSSIMEINYKGVTGAYFINNTFHRSNDYTILSVTPSGYKYEE